MCNHACEKVMLAMCSGAGSVLLKNAAASGKRRLLPLDKHAQQRIVVAGPMVRLVCEPPAVCRLLHSTACTLSLHSPAGGPASATRLLRDSYAATQAHTTEYMLVRLHFSRPDAPRCHA